MSLRGKGAFQHVAYVARATHYLSTHGQRARAVAAVYRSRAGSGLALLMFQEDIPAPRSRNDTDRVLTGISSDGSQLRPCHTADSPPGQLCANVCKVFAREFFF